jgi:hypothetical protein
MKTETLMLVYFACFFSVASHGMFFVVGGGGIQQTATKTILHPKESHRNNGNH